MIPPDAHKRVKRLQITTTRLVDDLFAGGYRSAFKGHGIRFEEVREYQPGDDVRFIDWNVTARAGRPFVKQFVEERELTVMLLVDLSPSCRFGTTAGIKTERFAELCALLAFAATRNSDKVGLLLFTDRIEHYVPPAKGTRHALRLIGELLTWQPQGGGTDIPQALRFLDRVMPHRTVSFICSDFYGSDCRRPLAVTGRGHDLIAVTLDDPAERALPSLGLLDVEDAESGQRFTVDTVTPTSWAKSS